MPRMGHVYMKVRVSLEKGMYGYYKEKRIQVLLLTVILFTLSIAIYFFGLYHLQTIQSYFTVIAVLGLLPSSKSAVNTIMHFRAKECEESAVEEIRQIGEIHSMLYSLYLTMYEHSAMLYSVYLCEGHVIVWVEQDADASAIETYMKNVFAMHHLGDTSVTVMKELKSYKKRVLQLHEKYGELSQEKVQVQVSLLQQLAL